MTTPTLVLAAVRNGLIDVETADELLAATSDARGWEANAYVARVGATLRRKRA